MNDSSKSTLEKMRDAQIPDGGGAAPWEIVKNERDNILSSTSEDSEPLKVRFEGSVKMK